MKEPKLAIVISHPVQYYSPLFKEMSKELDLKVFYCFNPNPEQQGKDGFGISFQWDVDLFDGYEYEFLENISKSQSSSLKSGCDTPSVGDSLEQFGATHVVTFGWHLKSYMQTLRFCKRKSIPIAVRGDSIFNPNQTVLKRWLKRIYYPFFLNQYDAFLSVGKRNRDYLKLYGIKDDKIIFSPHAVDQEFWKGIPQINSNFTFIWVGKFISLKRPFDVIDAFKLLNKKYPESQLKMIGSGKLLAGCKEKSKGVKSIQFLGFRNQKELKSDYLSSNVLILSSDSETWGLVVNEAFAAGIPGIVSSVCGCVPDLITSQTGFSYPFGDTRQLSKLMEKIMLSYNQQNFKNAILSKNQIYSFDRIILSFKEFLNLNE